MATIKWITKKHHQKQDGTFNPKIEITQNRTRAYISTSIYTELVKFKRGETLGKITDPSIEDLLNKKVAEIRKILNEKEAEVECLKTASEVKNFILRQLNSEKEIDFVAFYKEYIDTITKDNTKKYHVSRFNAFKEFLSTMYQSETFNAVKLTSVVIKDYEKWLFCHGRKTKNKSVGLSKNSVVSYIGALGIAFNALKRKYNNYDTGDIAIKNDPFVLYSPPKLEETKKRALTIEELRKIFSYSATSRTTRLAVELFTMSFYLCGMNLADFYDCKPFGDRVEYSRKKTRDTKRSDPFLSLLIYPKIAHLVDYYRDKSGEKGFSFYRQYKDVAGLHQAVRSGILVLRRELDIPDLTFYAARHSFATIARNECGIDMDAVAMCLTHKSAHNMSDIYVKKDYSKIDNVINVVAKVIGEW